MSNPGTPTFDQLRVFLAVVETGSFAGASRQLGRATSVISYGIANLEAQLGISLFDRESTKKPQLTAAGRGVLVEARAISADIGRLRAKVKGLSLGLEPELHLVIDAMMPAARIADAFKAFREAFPTVTLHLSTEILGAVTQLVVQQRATIGICGPLDTGLDGLEFIGVGAVQVIPVASPYHPLAQSGAHEPGSLRNHVQLVLTDRSPLTEGKDFAVVSNQTWRLADLGSKLVLLREGVGWGTMPEPMVREDIAAGRLVHLRIPETVGGVYDLRAIYRTDTPPGPAGRWMISRFQSQVD